MAWKYCKCGQGVARPTIEDICYGRPSCPVCERPVDHDEMNIVIETLIEIREDIEHIKNHMRR